MYCFLLFLQIDDYSLVSFLPLDTSEEDSLEILLMHIDNTIQYGEDLDIKVPGVRAGSSPVVRAGSSPGKSG